MSSTGKGMSERAFVDSVTQGFHVYASGSRETAKVAFGSGGAADAALSAVTQMMLAMMKHSPGDAGGFGPRPLPLSATKGERRRCSPC